MDKDITNEFKERAQSKSASSGHHPAIIEVVKLLARISAEKDYNRENTEHRKRHKKGLDKL